MCDTLNSIQYTYIHTHKQYGTHRTVVRYAVVRCIVLLVRMYMYGSVGSFEPWGVVNQHQNPPYLKNLTYLFSINFTFLTLPHFCFGIHLNNTHFKCSEHWCLEYCLKIFFFHIFVGVIFTQFFNRIKRANIT